MARPRSTLILKALCDADGSLTTAELAKKTGVPRKQISHTCERLRVRGLIEKPVGKGVFRATRAGRRLIETGGVINCGPCAPLTGKRRQGNTLRQRAWRTIGILQKFTVADVVTIAAKGDERAADDNVRRYLNALERAGYLHRLPVREEGTAPTSNGHVRWLRVRHTGPKAPVVNTLRTEVYDPNTRETHELEGEQ